MEKEEKDIRFVARFYRENRLDTTQAWQKLGIGKQRNNSILLYRLITIAAVTFLIAGFSWWWIYDRQDWIVIASSAHAVKEVTLPDNSHITLAENSALQYDRLAYGKKNRNVTLNGKAYFSVTHQEQCPFRVQTELANIQVLGTQFQVTANANQTSATVESGKVRFYNKEQKEAILTKGMYAFINQKGQMQINKQSDPNTFAWKTHVFVYNEAPLKKVVKELKFLTVLDNIAIATPLAGCFIRLGNLMNGEIVGTVTHVPWAFIFPHEDMQPRHPAQLYEAIAYLLIFIIGLRLYKKYKTTLYPGFYFGYCLTTIFTFRFLVEFIKASQEAFEDSMMLNMGQWLSIPFILLGAHFMYHSFKPVK